MDDETREALHDIRAWQAEHDRTCRNKGWGVFLILLGILGFLFTKMMGW